MQSVLLLLIGIAEYLPGSHAIHLSTDVAPASSEKRPALQLIQELFRKLPVSALYCPLSQNSQSSNFTITSSEENLPAAHFLHCNFEKAPISSPYHPRPHTLQPSAEIFTAEALRAVYPFGHSPHALALRSSVNQPSGQEAHPSGHPAFAQSYSPASHPAQIISPCFFPVGQLKHFCCPGSG